MPHAPRIPVILCIDAEPDGFFIDRRRSDPWLGYERSVEFFRRFRDRLQTSGEPARFTWCYRMDPQVAETYGAAEWVARHYETLTAQLIGDGDELGLHAHGYRWEAAAGAWTIDHGNQSWIDHLVRMSFAAFDRAFGEPCRTFRFGDRWMSNATVRLLAELGTRHDLTLEPGHPALDSHHPGRSSGSLPDYTGVPVDPYRPSPDDFRKPGGEGSGRLWMIPLTTAPVKARLFRRWYYRMARPAANAGVWTALVSHDPPLFRRIVAHALGRSSRPYLALVLRSNALATPRLARRVSANLEGLLSHPLAGRLSWVTPAGLIASLEP